MALKVLVTVAIASVALLACGQMQKRGGPTLLWTDCDTTGGTGAHPKLCVVKVSATIVDGACKDENIKVDPPELRLLQLNPSRIVWRLQGNLRFCALRGDGVFLKDSDDADQFSDPDATDDDNGESDSSANHNKCKRNFRIHDKNDRAGASRIYEYGLRFHTKDETIACVKDPFIKNGN